MAPLKAAFALWAAASASLLLSGAAVEAAVRQKKVVVTFELVNGSFVPVVREVKTQVTVAKKSCRITTYVANFRFSSRLRRTNLQCLELSSRCYFNPLLNKIICFSIYFFPLQTPRPSSSLCCS